MKMLQNGTLRILLMFESHEQEKQDILGEKLIDTKSTILSNKNVDF